MRHESYQQSMKSTQIRQQYSKEISTEPPVGGWNTRDSVDNVPPEDALLLDNWTCGLGAVAVRKGTVQHSYSYDAIEGRIVGPVKTLMKYDQGDSSPMLFAVDGGYIWNATHPEQAAAVDGFWGYNADGGVGTGGEYSTANTVAFSSDVFSWANFRGGAAETGSLIAVNGIEAVNWTFQQPESGGGNIWGWFPLSFNSPISPIGCFAFKNRMYYWEENSQSIWYTELYAKAGEVYEFDIGTIGQFGGYVESVETVTHDGGHGTDDYLLIIMSSGETLAYQGSYPADESDWAIVGIYNPGLPMGPRGFAKFGGDLYMMTDLDILPMSKTLAGVEARRDLTKISGAMQAVAERRGSFGFDVVIYPPSKLMIFNTPIGDGFEQFVMNTITGAWSRWKDLKSYCWIEFEGNLYYGSDYGVVYQAETGAYDSEILVKGQSGEAPGSGIIPYIYRQVFGYGPGGEAKWYLNTGDPDKNYINAQVIAADGDDYTADLTSANVGDNFTLRTLDSSKVRTIEVAGQDFYDWSPPRGDALHTYGPLVASVGGDFVDGEDVVIDLIGVPPDPPSGTPAKFTTKPILSDVQTSHLRFGVEENKQWDALKIFFRAGAPVIKELGFAVDYKEIKYFEYPAITGGSGTPWSGEWTPGWFYRNPDGSINWPPPSFPDEIPDPTTWWTDEPHYAENENGDSVLLGSNPDTPINEETTRSAVGAITPWSIEATTTEKWDIIVGYGRAITMLMKLQTRVQVEWNLNIWHLKLGTRM